MPQNRSLALVLGTVGVASLLAVAQAQQAGQAETSSRPAGAIIELTPEADTWYEVSHVGARANPTPQGASSTLDAGFWDWGIDEHALIRFSLPADLAAHQVVSAELKLDVAGAAIHTFDLPLAESGTIRLTFGTVAKRWEETTLSSLAPPLVFATGISADMQWRPCHSYECGAARADVTELVRSWVQGMKANNGLDMRASAQLEPYRPAMALAFQVGSRESDHPPVLRIQLSSAQPTNAGEESPTPSPTLATPEAPAPPGLCLPLLLRGAWPDQTSATAAATVTATAPPTGTSLPPHTSTATRVDTPTATATVTAGTATALPVDRYLLLERWETEERGNGCPTKYIDLPLYYFEPSSGVLYMENSNPRLEPGDIGYYGSGRTCTGRGFGQFSRIWRIDAVPYDRDDVRLVSVSDTGQVAIVRAEESIDLAPGDARSWQTVGPGDAGGSCIVTTTLRITNFGYQDRAKIEYYP